MKCTLIYSMLVVDPTLEIFILVNNSSSWQVASLISLHRERYEKLPSLWSVAKRRCPVVVPLPASVIVRENWTIRDSLELDSNSEREEELKHERK